ncbi:MAG: peptide ABC transporter substrate-binding protein, partial [Deltaproteobacteria bacterium]|nr:peptide ABC transporter substrate-binding protein [Kofleriaceae bacterium]
MRRPALAAGLIAAAALALTASAQQVDRSNTMIGAFDVGPGGAPQIFNPYQATAGFTWLSKTYGRLVAYDVGFTKIQGDLAQSWDVSQDGRTWTFH